jgi:mercuric ion transport protein
MGSILRCGYIRVMDCNCDTTEKTPFHSDKEIFGYRDSFCRTNACVSNLCSHISFQRQKIQTIITDQSNIQTAEFTINGMTCAGCEEHVNHEVNKLTGIIKTNVSYENGNAIIEFDQELKPTFKK